MCCNKLPLVMGGVVIASAVIIAGCAKQTEKVSKPGASAKPDHEHEHEAGSGGHAEVDHSAMAEAMLMISSRPRQPQAGEPATLKLMIHDSSGKMLKDFEEVHEKKVHLIIVRVGLDHFAHVHPELDSEGNMTLTHTFPVGGAYRLFADYKPAGGPAGLASAELNVAGELPEAPALKPNVPGNVQGDGLNADVSIEKATERAAGITFQLQDTSGELIDDLEPYLGAMGHLVVLSADGEQYVHAHPNEQTTAGAKVSFEAHFPGPGLYKGWGQFQRAGKVHTVPFVVDIQ